ncbi:MAG: hypothetical protein QW057_07275 [Candidatus Bathyarchaeia archaeon]
MKRTADWKRRGARRAASRLARSKAGISIAVSAVIISAAILSITFIAAYVSANVLEMQMQSTEFEQAKMNMQTLNEIIQDVGLKHGSGGSVRFNARAGGINFLRNSTAFNVTIDSDKGGVPDWLALNYSSGSLQYRGGSLTGTYDVNITNPTGLIVTRASDPLGYLRVEQRGGPWIKADYYRVRVINAGVVDVGTLGKYQFVDVTFIRLENGTFGGSGTQNVKVQNLAIDVTTKSYLRNQDYNSKITIIVKFGALTDTMDIDAPSVAGIALTVTVARVMISIT